MKTEFSTIKIEMSVYDAEGLTQELRRAFNQLATAYSAVAKTETFESVLNEYPKIIELLRVFKIVQERDSLPF